MKKLIIGIGILICLWLIGNLMQYKIFPAYLDFKHKNEINDFTRGGTKSEYLKIEREYTKLVQMLNSKVEAIKKKYNSVYVYTNDTSDLNIYITPNIKYKDTQYTQLEKLKAKIKAIKTYVANINYKGYWFSLYNNNQQRVSSLLYTERNTTKYYQLAFDYYLSKKQKDYIKKASQQKNSRDFKLLFGTNKRLALTKINIKRKYQLCLRESELHRHKIKRFRSPISPTYIHPKLKFYFFSLADTGGLKGFKKKIYNLKKIFMKPTTNLNAKIYKLRPMAQ